jgi:hypothetical protein
MSILARFIELESELFFREVAVSFPLGQTLTQFQARIADPGWRAKTKNLIQIDVEGEKLILRLPIEDGSFPQEAGWRADPISFHGRAAERDGHGVLVGRFRSYWLNRVAWLVVLNAMLIGALLAVGIGIVKFTSGEVSFSWEALLAYALGIGGAAVLGAGVRWDYKKYDPLKERLRENVDRFLRAVADTR